MPNMVLNSKAGTALNTFVSDISTDQKISLEGDFDKYFTLYAPQQYKTGALYIFTPDVMQAAIQHGAAFDMEIIGRKLYIYKISTADFASQTNIQGFIELCGSFGRELAEQNVRYTDDRVGNRAANEVAAAGKLLSRRMSIPTLIAMIAIVIVIVVMFVTNFLTLLRFN